MLYALYRIANLIKGYKSFWGSIIMLTIICLAFFVTMGFIFIQSVNNKVMKLIWNKRNRDYFSADKWWD